MAEPEHQDSTHLMHGYNGYRGTGVLKFEQ